MTLSIRHVAIAFTRGATKLGSKNVFIGDRGNTIYSYGLHFPIAIKLKDGYLFNKDTYSRSTSKQQFYVKQEIGESNIKAYLNTKKLLAIINWIYYDLSKYTIEVTYNEVIAQKI